MKAKWKWIGLALCWTLVTSVRADESLQEKAWFDASVRALQDGLYEQAEKNLDKFIQLYPNSDLLTEVAQLQLHARGEAQLHRGEFKAAAKTLSQLETQYPNYSRRLDVVVAEATARYRMGAVKEAIGLLGDSQGFFQKSAQRAPTDERVLDGELLLAQSYLDQKTFKPCLEILGRLALRKLSPRREWQRRFLMVRLEAAQGRLPPALKSAKGLLALAKQVGSEEYRARSVGLEAELLQQLKRPDEALKALEANLATNTPPHLRRLAALKTVQLLELQHKPAEAVAALEKFLSQHPDDPQTDLVWLTLGEFRLKQFYALDPVERQNQGSQVLVQALKNFERIPSGYTNSTVLGQALLDRGWCLWERADLSHTNALIAQSQAAFQQAAQKLPHSPKQAVARFKWADCQFRLKDYTGAVTNYRAVIANYDDFPKVTKTLYDQALYQMVRAGMALKDLTIASEAMNKILEWYPNSRFSDRGLLLLGQGLNRQHRPAEARAVFAEFINRFPQSPLLPEVRLALARAYELQGNWSAAIKQYDSWANTFTNHPALPQAEYHRALAYDMAGQETNAFHAFTNFVTRFPNNGVLAPLAQNWVADYYYRKGDYVQAEKNYQLLYQRTNWPTTELTYRARLMAGRAAFLRSGLANARLYFTDLINLLVKDPPNAPPGLLDEAFFMLGDTDTEAATSDSEKPFEKYRQAISAFSRISSTSPLAPRAWGRMGSCYLQLATVDTNRYAKAIELYQKVVDWPKADIASRSLAEIGLGIVAEKLAEGVSGAAKQKLLDQALDHFATQVFYGNNRRAGEKAIPYYVQQAGLHAIQLLEDQDRWREAAHLYRRMIKLFPATHPRLEKKLAQVEAKLGP